MTSQDYVQANFDWVTEPALWLTNWEHLGGAGLGNGLVDVGVPGVVVGGCWLVIDEIGDIYMIYKLPGTQMTLVLVGKDLQK